MRKILKITLGIILFIVVGTGVLIYEFTKCDESSLKSNYNFGISIYTDSRLENPTFYLPMPVFKNETLMVNMANMAIIENERKTDGWILSIIETKYGKMLKISAKEFVEVQKMVSVSMESDHIIDTINATENEPLLSQKFNQTQAEKYDNFIYADYAASSNAMVEVSITMSGVNQWWADSSTYDNSYNETLVTTLTGENHGWFPVRRELFGESHSSWMGIENYLRLNLIKHLCQNPYPNSNS